jgi:hypothetical protein
MRNSIFITGVIAAVLFSVLPARAGQDQKAAPSAVSHCDDPRCKFENKGVDVGLKPAIEGEVCFVVALRPGKRDVTLTLYDRFDGFKSAESHVLRQIKHERPEGEFTSFCIGKGYVSKTVWVDACDGDKPHSDRGIPSITAGLRSGRVDLCLRGAECPRYVEEGQ